MQSVKLTPNDSIQTALDSGAKQIILAEGEYYEKIVVTNSGVSIIGEADKSVKITFDDYAKKIHADGKEYNTFRTYTMLISAPFVALKNLIIENSAGNPQVKGQAVALSVNCDNFTADNCVLSSLQDTLFLGGLPDDLILRYDGFLNENERFVEGECHQRFNNCTIIGSVDFIFGCGSAVFKKCTIISKNDGRAEGFVAAPAHSLKQIDGFVFDNCSFVSDDIKNTTVYLARPWRDFGKAVFINCMLGKHINPALFDKWNDTNRDKTARFYYSNLSGIKIKPNFGKTI